MDAITHAYQDETAPVLLVRDVGADQRSDAGGVDVGNAAKIEDQSSGIVSPHFGLEIEQIVHQQWAA